MSISKTPAENIKQRGHWYGGSLDWCPDTLPPDPAKVKHVAGHHLWDVRRHLNTENRIHEVKCCVKCHLMIEETRGVTLDDIGEATARAKAVKQRIDAEIEAKNREWEREKALCARYVKAFCELED